MKEMTNAGDVKTPNLRKASRKASATAQESQTVWGSLKSALRKASATGGNWNDGEYSIRVANYGKTFELIGEAKPEQGMPLTAGTVGFNLVHESPGRFATIQVNDGVVDHRSVEVTVRKDQVGKFASGWARKVAAAAKTILQS